MTIIPVKVQILITATLVATVASMTAQQNQTTIKGAPMATTSSANGAEMFKAYCAACHGTSGKGNGPAAAALKVPPPDLTTLARRHGGKYPSARVDSIIRFGPDTPAAHGTKTMPIWGPLFGYKPEATQRITNLNRYIDSIQEK